ncbi:MAG: DUF3667 domain-containing protein [Chitinophaga sp.]|uniref:DUF3667 domain-containing protein n=1 Tax=Chitinophaga sp. TaxID=1869181 RepID=UPI0025C3CF26|nr:DUF3667 domain-containing protein [Chitinophaga sp.]MBV8252562.1 DUF3667 domain-containing protein [Chitinophaga sp.]
MKTQPLRSDNHCLNCGYVVPERFCSHCGQENTVQHETFGHLVKHFVADIFHYDSQFFLTLKYLLFKPGFLTREYMAGRRVRYVNPIKLYVFVSFVFFLTAFSVFSNKIININSGESNSFRKHKNKPVATHVTDSTGNLQSDSSDAPKDPKKKSAHITVATSNQLSDKREEADDTDDAEAGAYRYHAKVDTNASINSPTHTAAATQKKAHDTPLTKALAAIPHDSTAEEPDEDSIHKDEVAKEGDKATADALGEEGHGPSKDEMLQMSPGVKQYMAGQAALEPAKRDNKILTSFHIRVLFIVDLFTGNLRNQSAVGMKIKENLIHNAPKVMFVLLPLFALLMKWSFRKDKKLLYADHAIFALHFHAFMFIAMLVGALLFWIWPSFDGFGWSLWASFFYLVLGLYNNYGRSFRRTLWKASVIWLTYITLVVSVLFVVGTLIFAVFM